MSTYEPESGIAITDVRVSNFRSLSNVEVGLGALTVLIGANNAGKTSFLDALFAAAGSGRRSLAQDDIRLATGEAAPPRERQVHIDLRLRPIETNGQPGTTFPPGSFWTALWGSNIIVDQQDASEFIAFRTTLKWSTKRAEYVVERRALLKWLPLGTWLDAPTQATLLNAAQLEPIALHYIDAKRDLEDDLRRQGSFWNRLTDDLGMSEEAVAQIEAALGSISKDIIDGSAILTHLRDHLADLQPVVFSGSAGIDIAPVARTLRDMSKGMNVSFTTAGAQSFPLARHGMGTRSLASLLVFRAFASWRRETATRLKDQVHTVLALEEPESHLHPQAQRSLFGHIRSIPGQRIVSTHSPYFAGQARLEDLRLFIKRGCDTTATAMDLAKLNKKDDERKLQEVVIASRGDILFARAVVLFEGQTEEQALPVWAEAYWGASVHELGLSFVRVDGTNYFPYIWLAENLKIPWFVIADGEPAAVEVLDAALTKSGVSTSAANPSIVVLPGGRNFEQQLIAEGYEAEIQAALCKAYKSDTYIDDFIAKMHGQNAKGKGSGKRDYRSAGGRTRATLDALRAEKVSLAKPVALAICEHSDPARRFPAKLSNSWRRLAHTSDSAKRSRREHYPNGTPFRAAGRSRRHRRWRASRCRRPRLRQDPSSYRARPKASRGGGGPFSRACAHIFQPRGGRDPAATGRPGRREGARLRRDDARLLP